LGYQILAYQDRTGALAGVTSLGQQSSNANVFTTQVAVHF